MRMYHCTKVVDLDYPGGLGDDNTVVKAKNARKAFKKAFDSTPEEIAENEDSSDGEVDEENGSLRVTGYDENTGRDSIYEVEPCPVDGNFIDFVSDTMRKLTDKQQALVAAWVAAEAKQSSYFPS